MAFEEGLAVEAVAEVAHQLDLVAPLGQRVARDQRGDQRIVRPGDWNTFRRLLELAHARRLEIVGSGEILALADGPDHGRHGQRQALLDLVEQVQRIAGLAVHLVDEGDDRNVAQPADLEELAGARLDALGGVDDHDGGVHGGQRPVGILGEVLVARRVEQVEDAAAVLEGHDRGHDRDAARLLDRHPVRAGAAAVALGAHLAGKLDGAAEEQQLLGQRRLARVRVRDDGEGAPSRHFLFERVGHV